MATLYIPIDRSSIRLCRPIALVPHSNRLSNETAAYNNRFCTVKTSYISGRVATRAQTEKQRKLAERVFRT